MRLGASGTNVGPGGDELTSIGFKLDFDFNFIKEIADKINFRLSDYLHQGDEIAD